MAFLLEISSVYAGLDLHLGISCSTKKCTNELSEGSKYQRLGMVMKVTVSVVVAYIYIWVCPIDGHRTMGTSMNIMFQASKMFKFYANFWGTVFSNNPKSLH